MIIILASWKLKMNETNEEKEFAEYQMYCDWIWSYLIQKLSTLNKQISEDQAYAIFNKILDLNEVTENEIDKMISRVFKDE